MAEPDKVIEGQYRVLGGEVTDYSGGDAQPSGTVGRRGFLKKGVAALGAATVGGVALGRATAPGARESGPQGGEATIILERGQYFPETGGVLREAHLKGERTPLEGLYESKVQVITKDNPSSIARQERTEVPEFAGQFGLTRIQTPYGPVYQFDIPVAVLQRVPLSDLTVGFSHHNPNNPNASRPHINYAANLSTRDLVNVLNVQNPDHPTAADDKASFFFYRRDPQRGDLVRQQDGRPILNVIPIGSGPRLSDNNLAIRIRVDHSENPKFGMDSFSRSAGWIDQSGEREALEMTLIPKAVGPTQPQPAPSTGI